MAITFLADLLERTGELAEAAQVVARIAELRRTEVGPRIRLARLLARQGNRAAAEAALREADRLANRDAAGRYFLGNDLRRAGFPAEAEAAYREAVRLDGAHYGAAIDALGDLLEEQGYLARTLEARQEAARLRTDDAGIHTRLGRTCRKTGQLDEAVTAYRAALAIDPNSAEAREGLDYCLRVQRGEVPTAPPPRPVTR